MEVPREERAPAPPQNANNAFRGSRAADHRSRNRSGQTPDSTCFAPQRRWNYFHRRCVVWGKARRPFYATGKCGTEWSSSDTLGGGPMAQAGTCLHRQANFDSSDRLDDVFQQAFSGQALTSSHRLEAEGVIAETDDPLAHNRANEMRATIARAFTLIRQLQAFSQRQSVPAGDLDLNHAIRQRLPFLQHLAGPFAATWRCHEQSGHPLPAIEAAPAATSGSGSNCGRSHRWSQ